MRLMNEQLTPREREVAELLRRGLTNEEIASALGITLDGAKYHVSQILSKLGVHSREEAAGALSIPISRRQRWRLDGAFLLRFAGAALVCSDGRWSSDPGLRRAEDIRLRRHLARRANWHTTAIRCAVI